MIWIYFIIFRSFQRTAAGPARKWLFAKSNLSKRGSAEAEPWQLVAAETTDN